MKLSTTDLTIVIYHEIKESVLKADAEAGRFTIYVPSNTPKELYENYLTGKFTLTWYVNEGNVELTFQIGTYLLNGTTPFYAESAFKRTKILLEEVEEMESIETLEELEDFLWNIGVEEKSIWQVKNNFGITLSDIPRFREEMEALGWELGE